MAAFSLSLLRLLPVSTSLALSPNPLLPANLTRSSLLPTSAQPLVARRVAAAVAGGTAEAVAPEDLGVADTPEDAAVLVSKEEETSEDAEYDWKEEWYPLYLSKEVPDDAPLGLTVYDRQIVLFRDGSGVLRCYEDRCPHRLAKLSEGQVVDGRLECLYHGWQFEGQGQCVKIPQLPEGAKIPAAACVRTYEVRNSQGVVWVWMSDSNPPDESKLPWFEHYDRPGFRDISTIHELPYDHSILLENLMDPAHVPISHDRTDWTAKREDAQALGFNVTERTARGFAGQWWRTRNPALKNSLRFSAPCVLQNNLVFDDKKGRKQYFSALFLCRPAGQGKSMLIVRFGSSLNNPLTAIFPRWYLHQNAGKVFEQDMGFLSSQNEVLMREKVPTRELYLNLRSCDTWVAEYRKWMDRAGKGMPYYFGHSTVSLPSVPAVVEQVPAGLSAGLSASMPAKGSLGNPHAPNPTSRYFRHVVHCKGCRAVVRAFRWWKGALFGAAIAAAAGAIMAATARWRAIALALAGAALAGSYSCSTAVELITTNFVRVHRRL